VRHYQVPEAIIRFAPEGRLLSWDNAKVSLS
jgi:hypothetical protein